MIKASSRTAVKWNIGKALVALLFLGGCAQQQIRDEADLQVRMGQYEVGIKTLEDGASRYPESTSLRVGLVQAREESVTRLIAQASLDRAQGRVEDAAAALERARKIDARNTRIQDLQFDLVREGHVRQALLRARQQSDANQKLAAVRTLEAALSVLPRHPDLVALKRQLQLEIQWASGLPHRQSLADTRPIGLDLRNASLSTLLDAIRDGSGINFVVDRDVPMEQRASIFIRSASVEEVIDLVLNAFQLSRHIVDPQTVMVYPNTPEKHKQHREQVIRVFHLANVQAKTTATLLQSMLRIQPPFVDERANMIALRETPDIVALAERLVALHDLGEAEVMLEVEVMEVKSSRLTELGINLPNSVSFSPLPIAGQSGLTVDSLGSLSGSRIGVGIGNALLNLRREVGDLNTLANPKIRARSREKATILIGDKIPVITTTAGANGFVSENVSYQDVGLKLEVEPIVSPDDEVAIKLGLEVSSLAGQLRTSGGSIAYQIGTRNANTTLRLRDGETQFLGGLISKDDRSNSNRIPGLGDLPIAGRLFSSQKDELQRTELVLAITPRILRSAARPEVSMAQLWVGTENYTRLRGNPEVNNSLTSMRLASGSDAAKSAMDPPMAQPKSREGIKQSDDVVLEHKGLELKFVGPKLVQTGEEFNVALHATSDVPLSGMPMDLLLSGATLRLLAVSQGGYFNQQSQGSAFTHAYNESQGRLSVGLLSHAEKGVRGEGDVIVLRLKALSSGKAEIHFQALTPMGAGGSVPQLEAPRWSAEVQ